MTPHPRALIAEDEALLAAGLRAELATLWPQLQVVVSVGDGLRAVAQTLALQPDICFVDIRMPGCTGLQAAQALAEDWPAGSGSAPFPLLVFVTAYDDYALQAFKAQAVDYLLKPLDRPRLAACIARLQTRLGARAARPAPPVPASTQSDTRNEPPDATLDATLAQLRGLLGLVVQPGLLGLVAQPGLLGLVVQPVPPAPQLAVIQAQVGNLVHLVTVEEVIYFEAADKYVRVVTAAREHLIRPSLSTRLPQLDTQQFWQVHRSTVVQARCVASARREESGKVTLTLRGRQETLIASRLYAHLFKGM